MTWIVVAAGFAAVLALAGIAWRWTRAGGDAALGDGEAACRAAAESLPGFVATAALIGIDRRAALVVGQSSRVAILKARRGRIAAREVRWSDVRAVDGGMRVETGERRFGRVHVNGIDALDVRRAAGAVFRAH